MAIDFGTDGWRAVIAREYTFDNLNIVSKAAAETFKNLKGISKGILIGYDTRFLSDEFAQSAATVFAISGIKVHLTDSFIPTPVVSLITRDKKLPFGVMITSSHNPAKYNGFKLKDSYGGSMDISMTKKVVPNIRKYSKFKPDYKVSFEELIKKKKIEFINAKEYYKKVLNEQIKIELIKSSGIKIIYDAMYGAGQNIPPEIIDIALIRNEYNPSFGRIKPEPIEENLRQLSEAMKKDSYDIGFATDGDADRVAIMDENGNYIDAQKTFALMLIYLVEYKKMSGGVVKTISVSELIKKICDNYGLELQTVPIGFKYISDLMVSKDILMGGEESGGIGIKGHIPERDGIYNGLTFCEMIASTKKKLSEHLKDIEDKYGKYFYKRIDVNIDDKSRRNEIVGNAANMGKIIDMKITGKDTQDGTKLFFENGWLLLRSSGTEPLLRVYCETSGSNKTEEILNFIIKKFKFKNNQIV